MSARAAEVLKDARKRANLRQQQLAERANVAQSLISAYESGRREPTLPTLERLIAATGFELTLGLESAAAPPRAFSGPVGARVRQKRHELRQMLREHGIRSAYVFGSVARGEDRPDSDVDLLVDLPAETGIFTLASLARELHDIVGAPVDLVPRAGLKDRVRGEVALDLVKL